MPHTHVAAVRWHRVDPDFLAHRYSRAHTLHFDGGAVVPGSSSPQVVPLPWSDPSGVDPEETFVASISSCHMLWFLDFAARAGWLVDAYEDAAEGRMGRDAAGRVVVERVTLRPLARFGGGTAPDAAALVELHHRAHEACFIANSVRCEIVCEPVGG